MDIIKLNAVEIASKIKSKELSVVEVTKAYLDVIKSSDDRIGAWLLVDEDMSINNAKDVQAKIDKMLENGDEIPALAGVPVGIKDNMCTEGILTTCASKILYNFVPPYNATVINKINENLMVILGKTNMDEFAMGSSTEHSAFKKTSNPWDLERVPGGSSGGSAAAVSALQAPLTLGSDTGGSIRQPAGYCGVTGLKPTYGNVSRFGLVAFASSLDQIGPMAKDARGCAALYDVISGYDENDSTSYDRKAENTLESIDDFQKIKIGIQKEYMGEGISEDMKKAVLAAAKVYEEMGCEICEISIPVLKYALPAYYILSSAEASSNLSRFDGVKYGYRAQNTNGIDDLYLKTRSEGFGHEVKRRIMLGTYALCAGYYDEYYNKALKARSLVKQGFDSAFKQVDVLLSPIAPSSAFKFGEKESGMSMYLTDLCTVSVNIAGLPAISFPGGFDKDDMPLGLQFIGPKFSESLLLMATNTFQDKTDFHKQCPNCLGGAKQ